MRIIGGIWRGRPLKTPKNQDIRPTTDKVRQAIFNALFSRSAVEGVNVLDAFCGTGALGIEALSHGAEHVTFSDLSKISLGLAKENVLNLRGEGQVSFRLGDISKIHKRSEAEQPFDLVFLDPPYRKDLVKISLESLTAADWLAKDSWIVIEAEKDADLSFAGTPDFDKTYGDTRVVFIQK